jgi:hypothetical protein
MHRIRQLLFRSSVKNNSSTQARLAADAKRKRDKRRQDLESADSERRWHRTAQKRAREQDAPLAEAHRRRDRARKADERQHDVLQAETHSRGNVSATMISTTLLT